ncbi:MAG: urease accessory protein UreD [Eubacteriales bacterium]
MSENKFGKTSKVELVLSEKEGKTMLSQVDFTAPFKVMKPFYDAENHFSLMIMNSSAGIMEGDRQDFSITVESGAEGKIFSQSYEKVHKMGEGYGQRTCQLNVLSGGNLHYSPLPTIPYADSSFQGKTKIYLEDDSAKLIFSDIFACGRVAMGESFQYDRYDSEISVFLGDTQLFSDRAKYRPKEQDLSGFCYQEGYSHQSILLLFHHAIPSKKLRNIQQYLESLENAEGAYSKTFSGDFVFRFLGNSGDALEKVQDHVLSIVRDSLNNSASQIRMENHS